MNTRYPQQTFETDLQAINGFVNLLKTGFQNPEGIRGSVKIHVPEVPEHDFIARYAEELHIDRNELERKTDTFVSIPISTVKRIFNEFEYLDWRDPEIIGSITFSGNLHFANHLAKSCLRPSNFTQERFKSVGDLHFKKDYREMSEIEYLHQPTQRQVLETMEESRPVVITGMEPTTACRDWTIGKLADKYGDAIVRVRSATQKQNMRTFVQELQEFLERPYGDIVEGFVKPYTEGATMPREMWTDFGPLFFGRDDFSPPQLWLGTVPTHIPTSSLHRDPHCGFLLQVIGRKRFELFSADQEELIYPYRAYNNYQPCWFKPENPNYTTYPNAKKAKSISVTLNPGDMIMQPAGWFHQVYALDSPNMSVSYFWRY